MATFPLQNYSSQGKPLWLRPGDVEVTSTFTDASISSLTVSSINGAPYEEHITAYWALYPAVSSIDAASNDIQNVKGITAETGSFEKSVTAEDINVVSTVSTNFLNVVGIPGDNYNGYLTIQDGALRANYTPAGVALRELMFGTQLFYQVGSNDYSSGPGPATGFSWTSMNAADYYMNYDIPTKALFVESTIITQNIVANNISGSVSADSISTGQITTSSLQSGVIGATNINADNISVSSLQANVFTTVSTINVISTLSSILVQCPVLEGVSSINGIPWSSLSNSSDWSLYPAISNVNGAGFDFLTSGTVSTNNVQTQSINVVSNATVGNSVIINSNMTLTTNSLSNSATDLNIITSQGVGVFPASLNLTAEGGTYGKIALTANPDPTTTIGGLITLVANSGNTSLSRIEIDAATVAIQAGAVAVPAVPGALNLLNGIGTGIEVLATVGPINIAAGTTTTVAGGTGVVLSGGTSGARVDAVAAGNSKLLVQDIYGYEPPTLSNGEYLNLHGGSNGMSLFDTVLISGKPTMAIENISSSRFISDGMTSQFQYKSSLNRFITTPSTLSSQVFAYLSDIPPPNPNPAFSSLLVQEGISSSTISLSTLFLYPSTLVRGLDAAGGVLEILEPDGSNYGQTIAQAYTMSASSGASNGTLFYQDTLDRPGFLDNAAGTHTIAYLTDVVSTFPDLTVAMSNAAYMKVQKVANFYTAEFSAPTTGTVGTNIIQSNGSGPTQSFAMNLIGNVPNYGAINYYNQAVKGQIRFMSSVGVGSVSNGGLAFDSQGLDNVMNVNCNGVFMTNLSTPSATISSILQPVGVKAIPTAGTLMAGVNYDGVAGFNSYNGKQQITSGYFVTLDNSLPGGKGQTSFKFNPQLSSIMSVQGTYFVNSSNPGITHPIWTGNATTNGGGLYSTIQIYGQENRDVWVSYTGLI